MWNRANQAFIFMFPVVPWFSVIYNFAWCFVRMEFLFQKWLQWAFQNALADNIITLHKKNHSTLGGIESGWQRLNWQQANRWSQLMNYFEFSRNHLKTRFSSKLVHGVFEDAFDAKLMTINDGKGFALFLLFRTFKTFYFWQTIIRVLRRPVQLRPRGTTGNPLSLQSLFFCWKVEMPFWRRADGK